MARKLNDAEKAFIIGNPQLSNEEVRDKCNKEVTVREIETFRSGVEAANKHIQAAQTPVSEPAPTEEPAPKMANPLDMMRRRDESGKVIENAGVVIMTQATAEMFDENNPMSPKDKMTDARDVLRNKKVPGYFKKNEDKIHRIR